MNSPKFKSWIDRLASSPVVWGGAMTLLRGLGFLVVMAYALQKIPTPEIGLWYVMLSIAGLGAIVEFGFAATIGRYASYYSGGAVEIPRVGMHRTVSGSVNKPAIAALLVMVRRLYLFFGLVVGGLMLVMWPVWLYWGEGLAEHVGIKEAAAFFLLVSGTAFNMTGMYWTAILYGMNRVRLLNQWMVAGLIVNYAVALAGLLAGAGIAALVAGQIVGSVVPRLAARQLVLAQLAGVEPDDEARMSWRELWPTTWRSGVLTLCTYLMITTTTMFCFAFSDIRTAASYGLTMQMALMLHTTSTLWVWVKIPAISAMRIQGNWSGIWGLLRVRLPVSVLTYAVGAVVIIVGGPWLLAFLESRTEMLPPPQMAALFTLIALDLIVGHHSALLQTGNEVPQVRAFCVSAALTLLLAWPLGSRFQVWGVMGAPFLAQLAVNYWFVPYQFWSRLHAGIRRQAPVDH